MAYFRHSDIRFKRTFFEFGATFYSVDRLGSHQSSRSNFNELNRELEGLSPAVFSHKLSSLGTPAFLKSFLNNDYYDE